MIDAPGYQFEPLYIDAPHARLFSILHSPPPGTACVGSLILVPAFGEEMNRCRYMVAEQSRRLAARGWQVLVPDLYGTGDSEGEFCQASWQGWQADIAACIDWMRDRENSPPPALWGIRLGAALAVSILETQPAVDRLLFWQPVLKGSAILNQLLRMRMGAAISMGQAPESSKDLRERLRGGETLRIGGYDINPTMADAIENLDMAAGACARTLHVDWFEVVTSDPPAHSPASRKLIAQWQNAGHHLSTYCVADPPYWQVHERAIGENLMIATTEHFLQSDA